jgi:hypothetical protein
VDDGAEPDHGDGEAVGVQFGGQRHRAVRVRAQAVRWPAVLPVA